ncbi:MAG TPA: FAD:protein FMN transferase [Solimonas sp.]|nr:FAD:protein FMN transferase [Solimonas sp.]
MASNKTLRFALPWLVALAILAWLALREPPQVAPPVLQREFLAMGTLVSLSLHLADGQDRSAGEAALVKIERELRDFEARWSPGGDGALGRLNSELAAGRAAPIDPVLAPLLVRAFGLREVSAGVFDPRLGALVRLWGFDDESHFLSRPPPTDVVTRLAAQIASAPAQLADCPDAAPCYGPAPGVQFDLGAIAKGEAAALAIAQLRQEGFPDAIVNLGGNLVASGARGGRPWNIGIRHPRPEGGIGVLATLHTSGTEAVMTSGDYERYFEFEGRRYHHILDPASGQPAQGLVSATVVHADGALADAASTALLVAGPQGWRETARALGISQALVVDESGRINVTAALAPRLEFAPGLAPATVVP